MGARDVRRLMDELDLPGDGYWVTKSRSRFTREEAFLLYLRRLSYPATLQNLADEGFSAQPGSLSELYKMVDEWIFENHTGRKKSYVVWKKDKQHLLQQNRYQLL